jgi:single-strand DNA-binding protein
MNNITICGSIGEPRFREVNTKTGTREIASFGICQNEGKDAQGNTIFAWYNAEYWLNEGSKLKQYLTKGAKILAVGELKTEKWKAQDGTERSTIKIAVRGLELVGGKQEQAPVNPPAPATTPIYAGAPQVDDLPF